MFTTLSKSAESQRSSGTCYSYRRPVIDRWQAHRRSLSTLAAIDDSLKHRHADAWQTEPVNVMAKLSAEIHERFQAESDGWPSAVRNDEAARISKGRMKSSAVHIGNTLNYPLGDGSHSLSAGSFPARYLSDGETSGVLRYTNRAVTNKSINGNAVATGLSIADDYDQSLIASIDNLMPAAEVENSCKNSCCYFGSPATGNNECMLGDGAMICTSRRINKGSRINKGRLINKSTSKNIDTMMNRLR